MSVHDTGQNKQLLIAFSSQLAYQMAIIPLSSYLNYVSIRASLCISSSDKSNRLSSIVRHALLYH